mgnify:CR=1 FL=1
MPASSRQNASHNALNQCRPAKASKPLPNNRISTAFQTRLSSKTFSYGFREAGRSTSYLFTFLLLNSLFTSLLFYPFTLKTVFLLFYFFTFLLLKKQGFFCLQTRLLSNANKASFETKEALFGKAVKVVENQHRTASETTRYPVFSPSQFCLLSCSKSIVRQKRTEAAKIRQTMPSVQVLLILKPSFRISFTVSTEVLRSKVFSSSLSSS